MNELDETLAKRMDASPTKQQVTELALSYNPKTILDVGCGTCKMAKEMADKGAEVIGIDENRPAVIPNGVKFIQGNAFDVMTALYNLDRSFDVIVMSAFLHEISLDELHKYATAVSKLLTKGGKLIIREPLVDYSDFYYMRSALKEVESVMGLEFLCDYYIQKKKNSPFHDSPRFAYSLAPKCWLREFIVLNAAFVYAYGADSYDREKHELRYIYTLDNLKTEFKQHNLECVLHQKLKDESYKKIFADCGFPDSLYDSLTSTSDITVFEKQEQ